MSGAAILAVTVVCLILAVWTWALMDDEEDDDYWDDFDDDEQL